MAETYSLAVTGINAGSAFTAEVTTIGDSQGRAGSQQQGMRQGTQVLCKNPDGSLSWYTVDPNRTTNYAFPVLLKAYG